MTITKMLATAGFVVAATVALPASAQVSGNVGIINPPATVVATDAMRTAYQQIATTYNPQITQITQKRQQAQAILQPLDTNKDGNLDEAESRALQGSPQLTQLQTLEREIGTLSNQVDLARVYAVEQVLQQYNAALEQVVQRDKIQLVLTPESVAWSTQAANLNQKVVTALNSRVPSVQIVPPAGYQPTQGAVAMYQEMQQLIAYASARQQAAQQPAAAAQQPQQPAAQPTGR